jgi:hypothetical protein
VGFAFARKLRRNQWFTKKERAWFPGQRPMERALGKPVPGAITQNDDCLRWRVFEIFDNKIKTTTKYKFHPNPQQP